MRIVKSGLLSAAAVIAMSIGAAQAADNATGRVLNGQINLSRQTSALNVVMNSVDEASAAAVGIGNNASVSSEATRTARLTNELTQRNNGPIGAGLTANINDFSDDVALTAAGIGNSYSGAVTSNRNTATVTDTVTQTNLAVVGSTLNGQLNLGTGPATSISAALGNSANLSVDGNTTNVRSVTNQLNRADVAARSNLAVSNATRSVSATTAAIGNSVSVVNGL